MPSCLYLAHWRVWVLVVDHSQEIASGRRGIKDNEVKKTRSIKDNISKSNNSCGKICRISLSQYEISSVDEPYTSAYFARSDSERLSMRVCRSLRLISR